jgi:hypothetical protein
MKTQQSTEAKKSTIRDRIVDTNIGGRSKNGTWSAYCRKCGLPTLERTDEVVQSV